MAKVKRMKALAPSKNTRTDRIIILGSTGSIGVNTIEVVEHLNRIGSRQFEIVGLAAGTRLEELAAQADALGVAHVASPDPGAKARLSDLVKNVHVGDTIYCGGPVGSICYRGWGRFDYMKKPLENKKMRDHHLIKSNSNLSFTF